MIDLADFSAPSQLADIDSKDVALSSAVLKRLADKSPHLVFTFLDIPTKGQQQAVVADVFYKLRSIKHKNLLEYVGFAFVDSAGSYRVSLVMKTVKSTTLSKSLSALARDNFSGAKMCAVQAAEAVMYLHGRGIVVGNLCSETVLVDDVRQVYLNGYGISQVIMALRGKMWYLNRFYCAPELLSDQKCLPTTSSDVWSFGVLLFELFGKQTMKKALNDDEKLILKCHMPSLEHIPSEIAQVIERCWSKKPADRPSMIGILSMINEMGIFKEATEMSRYNALLEAKVQAGNLVAMNEMADALIEGRDGFPANTERAVELYRKAAEKGLSEAMSNYGVCLQEGDGVQADEKIGFEFIRKAAKAGNADGLAQLGMCYRNGHGVQADPKKGLKYLKEAAMKGNAFAQVNYGIFLQEDEFSEEGARWIEKAAEQGDPEGLYNMALCCLLGDGVPKDLARGAKMMHEAAMKDHPLAQMKYAEMLREGLGVPRNEKAASAFMLLAVSQNAEGAEMAYQAMTPADPVKEEPKPKDVIEKVYEMQKELKAASDEQYTDLKALLEDAVHLILRRKGRKRRHDKSNHENHSQERHDTPVDSEPEQRPTKQTTQKTKDPTKEEAKTLEFKRKANEGDLNYAFHYGMRVLDGKGTPKDLVEGSKWLRRCAKRGLGKASFKLAQLFKNGHLGEPDLAKAEHYLQMASNQKLKEAISEWGLVTMLRGRNIQTPVLPTANDFDDPDILLQIGQYFISHEGFKRAEDFLIKARDLGNTAANELLTQRSRPRGDSRRQKPSSE